jgi:hypothetical protein
MPLLINTRHTKKHVPDREMNLQLDEQETKKFIELFPEFGNLNIESFQPSKVTVTVTITAFLKTKIDAVEEKD